MVKSIQRKLLRLCVVGLIIVAGGWLSWYEPAYIAFFHERVWDSFVELKPRPYDDRLPVRIVDIDEASLAEHGQWPWPRTRIARLVEALAAQRVRVVVFDVIFAEPDRSSLDQVFEALKADLPGYVPPLAEDELARQPQNDRMLAAAMAKVPVVLGLTVLKSGDGEGALSRPLENLPRVAYESRVDQRYLPRFADAVSSLTPLQKAAVGNAGIDMSADPDGITRRVPLLFKVGRLAVPSLSLAAVQAAEGGEIKVWSRLPGVRAVSVGGRMVPTDRYARMRLYDSGSVAERYVSARDVLAGRIDGGGLAGVIAIVGTSAEGLHDLRLTPLERWVPGMETHAQAIEQMLSGTFLERPDWGPTAEAAAALAIGVLLLIATWWTWARLPPWLIAVVFGLALLGAGWLAFDRQALLLDPVLPAATLMLAAVLERFLLVLDLRRERSIVRNAFSRYLAPALVEQLAADPDRLRLGGEMRQMTFLFSDVRGFTSISEGFKQDPQGLTRLINRFLTPMTDIIMAEGGTIDKYMGDCIMAFWNAPLDEPEHARRACRAALAMMAALKVLNAELTTEAAEAGRTPVRLDIGVGLNTGECVVGNMGSEQRFDYSVLGDAVNLASRLEGQSKTYGVGIVIGERTQAAAPEYATLELDLIAVKGKAEAVRIYALLGDEASKQNEWFQPLVATHGQMLAAYRAQDWDQAAARLQACRLTGASLQTLYGLYETRIAFYRENPPGPEWDGVFIAESK